MSEPSAGDRATVIRDHCEPGNVGAVVVVREVAQPHPGYWLMCSKCLSAYASNEPHAFLGAGLGWHPLRWLAKLPPEEDVIAFDKEELETA